MTKFDEAKIRRDTKGRFADKPHDEAVGVSLQPMPQPEQVRYSFLEDWEDRTDEFNTAFEGVPTRFFTADPLKDEDVRRLAYHIDLNHDVWNTLTANEDKGGEPWADYQQHIKAGHGSMWQTSNDPARHTLQRLTYATTAPKDGALTDEQVRQIATELDLTDVRALNERQLRSVGAKEAWSVKTRDGHQYIVVDKLPASRDFQRAWMRRSIDGFDSSFQRIDTRSLVGAARLHNMTGVNALELGADKPVPRPRGVKYEDYKREEATRFLRQLWGAQQLLDQVEAKRREGANFRAQAKYVKQASAKTTARAWEDKLHPDKTHQQMMADTALNDTFSKVEIDNDVSAEEFADFEATWEEAAKRLPQIPGRAAPTLRIRKLGRHKATGMYFPHVNTVVVDVRDSSSMVHEMGHYYDIATQNNASLDSGFVDVVDSYSKNLVMPKEAAHSSARAMKADYYQTPTEVFARGFEMWAHERQGVRGRVLNPNKFNGFAYAPFHNPELKTKLFAFFDERFGGN